MIDYTSVLVIVALLGYIAWDKYQEYKQTELVNRGNQKLINALVAKSARELEGLEYAEKAQPQPQLDLDPTPQDLPIEALSEEEFDKHIQEEYADNG